MKFQIKTGHSWGKMEARSSSISREKSEKQIENKVYNIFNYTTHRLIFLLHTFIQKESPEMDRSVNLKRAKKEKSREVWYYPPNGNRPIRYLFCVDCTYKTTIQGRLAGHVEKYHPSPQPSLTSDEATQSGSQTKLTISPPVHPVAGHMKKPTYESVIARYKTIQVM